MQTLHRILEISFCPCNNMHKTEDKQIENYISGERFANTVPWIEQAEQEWWDEFSEFSEYTWGYNNNATAMKISRLHYLKKMANFLMFDTKSPEILEVGCGTGWVGRFLAQMGAKVWGIDNSINAIQICHVNAKKDGVDANTQYTCGSIEALSGNKCQFDGVILHAVLHHLTYEEINNLLASIKKALKPGGRLFVYEHECFDREAKTPLSVLIRKSQSLMTRLHRQIYDDMIRNNLIEKEHIEIMQNIGKWSEIHGSVGITPKEFPFKENELEKILSHYFVIKRKYFCTVMDYTFVHLAILSNSIKFQKLLLHTIIRAASLFDRFLSVTGWAKYVDPKNRHIGWPFVGIEAVND